MRTQINNFDAGRGNDHQIGQYLPAPEETESSITTSKLLMLGVFIGCLAAAGILLFFLVAARPASASKTQASQQGVGALPEAAGIMQPAEGQNQIQNKSRINKPRTDRSRGSQRSSSQNEYKNSTIVTSPGHAPKMLESQ